MIMELENIVKRYRDVGIENQIDYDKFYLYSLITHSTAIEGSTITENDELDIFREFMTKIVIKNLNNDIEDYLRSIGE